MSTARPSPRHRRRAVRRAVESLTIAAVVLASMVYAGIKAALLDVVVSTDGSPETTRTLGELLTDLATGRATWPVSTQGVLAVVSGALAVAVVGAVCRRRRHRPDIPCGSGASAPPHRSWVGP